MNLAESFDRKTAKGEWMEALDRAMARWAEAVETLEGLEGSWGGEHQVVAGHV